MRLKDKVVIVTGGSRGIGFATAEAFVREGAAVILTASRQETADKAVAQLKEKFPNAAVEGIWPNLSSYDEVKAAVDAVIEKYGKIDVLVNNAGVSESTPLSNYTESLFDKVLDLNVKAVFNFSKAVSEQMT